LFAVDRFPKLDKVTLQYNISNGQPERPIGPTRASKWIPVGAIAGAFALHGVAVLALLALAAPQGAALEDAAIAIFIDPGALPVATAMQTENSPKPEVAAAQPQPDLQDAVPLPEPVEAIASTDFKQPTPPPELRDAVPPAEPVEALAIPDFKPPPPPPKVEPRKPTTPPPPRAAAPAPAKSAPASPGPPAQGAAPGNAAPSAPPAAPQATAAAVAPGWNALIAAWLAAHRRYPEESRRRSEEGEVTVRFTVAGDGRVTDVALVKGSGWSALDASALRMLQGATVPAPGVETTRTVRIRFRLAD
jgi:periplasmic protein TonB